MQNSQPDWSQEFSLAIGRWQTLPPHKGHQTLINTLLNEGKNVCIDIRTMPEGESDPYTPQQVLDAWAEIYADEIKAGQVVLTIRPNIVEVVYGRTPGWGIREVVLDEEIQKISATEIRKQGA
jgi:hypothetical protein